METVDVIIVGSGVVGLAIAAQMSKTQKQVFIIDKNNSFGEETSSRNSEVIHAGIYYPEHSLKAKFCNEGKKSLYQYCQKRHIPFNNIGKLIVAQNCHESHQLEKIKHHALQNEVNDLTLITQAQLQKIEPQLKASSALLSPSTGIIDSHAFMQSLLAETEHNGGQFIGKTKFIEAEPIGKGFIVTLNCQGDFFQIKCRYLINSAGLHSTEVANNILGLKNDHIPKLHWCRGHYFSYSGHSPFSHLIYPIPEKNTVGLGIHATLDIAGQLKFGPDTQYINELDYQFPLALKSNFYQAILRYFPNIQRQKLHPAYSGIRPKLQGPDDTFKDFEIQTDKKHNVKGLINLFGIESPGLTASLAIGQYVADSLLSNN
ncbi:NAD(P)/FAD-dependent oxidoreductase [Pseudoalteromonas denitrificans]|uniref:L-2-hydroxyglutarate oxidase LhgO n=1 Tax=Pseudoalteromonas denitrificans DSM 6059 TaxID=1123010 RepID=A0A1I1MZN0_9GAMM|nr:NAD(P)/FAD-dependent oxidoreductase [Pseudoalteromonas denitrificans]SFC88698.1 L-2-hydroxyglutarate oxidase LhgO [Pseudoalteromonas denitrificans DSM 6059]